MVPRVSRVAHVPLAACKSRSPALCHWHFWQPSLRKRLDELDRQRTVDALADYKTGQRLGSVTLNGTTYSLTMSQGDVKRSVESFRFC